MYISNFSLYWPLPAQSNCFSTIWQMGGSWGMHNRPTMCGNGLPILFKIDIADQQIVFRSTYIYIYIYVCVYVYVYIYVRIWHRSLHPVGRLWLQSTPLDAHRDGSMSAASFRVSYDTRDKLWPIMFQNAIVPGKNNDSPRQYRSI